MPFTASAPYFDSVHCNYNNGQLPLYIRRAKETYSHHAPSGNAALGTSRLLQELVYTLSKESRGFGY